VAKRDPGLDDNQNNMRAKRIRDRVFVVFLSTLLSLTLSFFPKHISAEERPSEKAVEPVTLRWAQQGPQTGVRSKIILWMGREIEKHTDGRIKIQMKWNADLTKEREILGATMTGNYHMGTIDVADYPRQLFTWGIFNAFMIGPSDPFIVSEIKQVCIKQIPAFNAELERWNQRLITFFNYLPSVISLTRPITSINHIKGRRIGASSIWLLAMLEAIGARGVSIPGPGAYAALERGSIDGYLSSLDHYYRYSLDEVVKNYLFSKNQWQPQPVLVTVNRDVWNALLEADRKIIVDIGKKALKLQNKLSRDFWDLYMSDMKKRSNAVFTEMPETELKTWAELPAVKELPQQWVKEAKAAGLPANEILELVKKKIQQGLLKEQQRSER